MVLHAVTTGQVTDFVLTYKADTADGLGVDMRKVWYLVSPKADLNILVMLSKAVRQGLEIAFIDTAKLQNTTLKTHIIDNRVNLSGLMITGYNFVYDNEHADGFISDFIMDTEMLVKKTVKHFMPEFDEANIPQNINNIEQLTNFINNPLAQIVETNKPLSRLKHLRLSLGVLLVLLLVVLAGLLAGILAGMVVGVVLCLVWLAYKVLKHYR